MRVGLHDADNTRFPNLALMKISAAYKAQGHAVQMYSAGNAYDKVVSSKVFTYTPEEELPADTVKGGSGYALHKTLPDSIEHICPDYALYGLEYSLGFLTRGCIRKCPHCMVPEREGGIRPHADIEEFCRHREVVLMDNNILACDHGLDQIDKMARIGVKVDFNQGLDARLIDELTVRRLAKLKWRHPARLACDSYEQMGALQKAVTLMRWFNVTPTVYFCYVLVKDVADALERLKFLKGLKVDPFCQPYRDAAGTPPTLEQRQLSRWANTKQLFKSMSFEDYKEWRGDRV